MGKIFLTFFIAVIVFAQCSIVAADPVLTYRVCIQGGKWTKDMQNGETAGSPDQNKRLEAIVIDFEEDGQDFIEYCAHVQEVGWQNWRRSGDVAGTEKKNLRMEAVKIQLRGEYANKYDICYRAHVEGIGWMEWVKNGEEAGTTGQSKRMEAIQIRLVEKSNVPITPPIIEPSTDTGKTDTDKQKGEGGHKPNHTEEHRGKKQLP